VAPYRESIPEIVEWIEGISIDWTEIENRIAAFFQSDSAHTNQIIDTVVSAAFSVFGKMFSVVFALIIAFTAVSQKEKLAQQAKNVLYAFAQPSHVDCISEYVRKIGGICTNFISGQVLEAFILGTLVMVGMLIFRFPHVLAISSLVMLMAFIPIVGAWVSAGVGAIMILSSVGVVRALGFILMIIVLQQIEGNLIYPKVMGKRIGLPSLWVLVAITLGSGALGAIGMLIFVPIFAVVYQLLNEVIEKRKAARLVKAEAKQKEVTPG
ncbi:MAG: AI-2E family transporter, partial [Clostridia bacterium]|nr:AI-2E family transporter [Clostridia bacterium]